MRTRRINAAGASLIASTTSTTSSTATDHMRDDRGSRAALLYKLETD